MKLRGVKKRIGKEKTRKDNIKRKFKNREEKKKKGRQGGLDK